MCLHLWVGKSGECNFNLFECDTFCADGPARGSEAPMYETAAPLASRMNTWRLSCETPKSVPVTVTVTPLPEVGLAPAPPGESVLTPVTVGERNASW